MFIELVESLRCLGRHEDTWLVAAVDRFDGRYIAQGSLGCPTCKAQYAVRDGAVGFAPAHTGDDPLNDASEDEFLRLCALLDLADAGGAVALFGPWAAFAKRVDDEVNVWSVAVNPSRGIAVVPGLSTVWVDHTLPLAAGSLRGVVLSVAGAATAMRLSAVRALRAGGRMVAPTSVPVPPGIEELARDVRQWVGQRALGAEESAPITLTRRTQPR